MFFLVAAAYGCSNGASVVVDLRTDLRPAVNFAYVRTELRATASGAARTVREVPVVTSSDVASGMRIAAFDDVPAGTVYLSVSLHDADGLAVAERLVSVHVRGPTAVTVLVVSACIGVRCEGDEVCVGGTCGDPRCTPETPEHCAPWCDEASCVSPVACAGAACVDGACFVQPNDALCGPSEVCDPRSGCRSAPTTDGGLLAEVDAGPSDASSCPGAEVSCDDGIDEDCDGWVDCADPDCVGRTCDDGIFCDGPDQCMAGACRPVGSDPCDGSACHEAEQTCGDCITDADCPSESATAWDCSYADVCVETSDATRDVTRWSCVDAACEPDTFEETDPGGCVRDTDGTTCDTQELGAWSCTYLDRYCSEMGDRTRLVTDYLCVSGTCDPVVARTTETASPACARSTSGTFCPCPVGCTPCTCAASRCDYTCAPVES
ncbi:MAG: hypothetical protein KC619_07295 [Myxococcales bacterium]|nr:hypothetical protein [Myxococcales bacterium]